MIAGERVLPQLHHRIRPASGAGIVEPGRLHRPEAQGVAAAVRHHLDGQAALEELRVVEVVHGRRLRRDERVVEAVVLVARERTIQIVALAVVDAAGGAGDGQTRRSSSVGVRRR